MRAKPFTLVLKVFEAFGDLAMFFFSANLAFVLRYDVDWKGILSPAPAPWDALYRAMPLMLAVCLAVFVFVGLYSSRLKLMQELFLLLKASVIAACLIFAAAFFYRGFSYSRIAAAFLIPLSFALSSLFRLSIRAVGSLILPWQKKSSKAHAQKVTAPKQPEPDVIESTPRVTEHTASELTASEPAVPEPTDSEATDSEPTDSEPTDSEPTASEQTASEPYVSKTPGSRNAGLDSSEEPVIRVENAGVRYTAYKSRRRNLREALFRSMLRRDEKIDVWALKDVSFEVAQGDSLGVIGANGAGKSTLCLLLSQIMTPTRGTVKVRGEVSALLTLGAGFQLDLTGRDNIFLNGVYLGFTLEQMRRKFPEIMEFSGIREYIDMPVRTYSSGMRARLAFSIAAIIEPEIMIIDELMGVGDMKFRQKSTKRMQDMITRSKALVVVSHSMETIRSLCTKAIWLDKGRLKAKGTVEEVIRQYEAS